MSAKKWSMEIDRDFITNARITDCGEPTLAEGQIEMELQNFAMTANNITYAALGKPIGLFGNDKGYWDFFSAENGPGQLPVWGFAKVSRSKNSDISVGDVFYGYYPAASHVVLKPGKISPHGFADQSVHRLDMPAVYNSYIRASTMNAHEQDNHDWLPVFRPLYMTGWFIADQFEDENDYGVDCVVTASASSKTAVSFAHAMRERASRPHMIGLTSTRGAEFLQGSKLYDELVVYDQTDTISNKPLAVVDMAGNNTVMAQLSEYLGENLKFHLTVGKSHWDSDQKRSWPTTGFFAPGRIEKRINDWGSDEFRKRTESAWAGFLSDAKKLFHIDKRHGASGVLEAYLEVANGKADPRAGIVIEV